MTRFWRVRNRAIPLLRPLLMGVVNTTPDSFSDGGMLPTPEAAVRHGRELAAAGADIIDIGGESTRPGADPVDVDEEIERTIPVVERLAGDGLLVSIDTTKPEVARAALDAGALIVNDVSGMGDPGMRRVAADFAAGVIVMHMQGTPRTMQDAPSYDDVVADITSFLDARCRALIDDGADRRSIVVDPGVGFGKTVDHNLTLLNRLDEFGTLGFPIMVGVSRKRFLGSLTGRERPEDRDLASVVAAAAAAARGAAVVRVHNVALSLEALRVAWAIVRGDGAPWAPVVAEVAPEGVPQG